MAKILNTGEKADVVVFGAVYLKIPVETFVDDYRDIEQLAETNNYLAVKKFSDPPGLSDVRELTIDEQEVEDIRNCVPGKCEIQMPADRMAEFQRRVDWSAPDAGDQVNRLTRQMVLEGINRHQRGGLEAILFT